MLFVVDLPADLVLLLIEGSLFLLGDMPSVLRSHSPFFLPNLPILFVQLGSLRFGQRAVFDALVNPSVLVREPFIDFRPARVIFLPFCFARIPGG